MLDCHQEGIPHQIANAMRGVVLVERLHLNIIGFEVHTDEDCELFEEVDVARIASLHDTVCYQTVLPRDNSGCLYGLTLPLGV